MTVNYNTTGMRRKELVKKVSETLGGWEVKYLGAPTFSYRVGDFEIDRNGTLIFDDRTDSKLVERVLETLAQAGFECEEQTRITETVEDTAEIIEEKPEAIAEEITETDTAPMDSTTAEEPISLSVSLPRESFTATALDNLDGLLESKGNLIKKAFGIEEANYTLESDRITFHWLNGEVTPESSKACQDFIGKLCEMARNQKRVTAKPKSYENEKYAFRCFLLRLGLIGNEYKTSRKILLQNLSGNSSWRDGKRKEAAHDEVSEHGAD